MHEKSPSFSVLKLGLCLRSELPKGSFFTFLLNRFFAECIKENITSPKASIKFYFSGYLKAIEDAAGASDVNLDMTYESLDNLKPANVIKV
jgi:hypothetical protein